MCFVYSVYIDHNINSYDQYRRQRNFDGEGNELSIWWVADYYGLGGYGKPAGRSEWPAYDILLYIYNRRKDII